MKASNSIAPDCLIYDNCNIYNGTVIMDGCKVGAYTEISGAVIGHNVTISAKCFIVEGVTIEDNVFVGPGVFFTHSFPPATRAEWKPTLIKRGAKIGAGAIIKEGVTIGEDAVIGCGAVVTKDVPDGETWAGNPAQKLKKECE